MYQSLSAKILSGTIIIVLVFSECQGFTNEYCSKIDGNEKQWLKNYYTEKNQGCHHDESIIQQFGSLGGTPDRLRKLPDLLQTNTDHRTINREFSQSERNNRNTREYRNMRQNSESDIEKRTTNERVNRISRSPPEDRSLSRNRESSRFRERDNAALSERHLDNRISSRNNIRGRFSEIGDQSRQTTTLPNTSKGTRNIDVTTSAENRARLSSRHSESSRSSIERSRERDLPGPSERHFENKMTTRNNIRERSSEIRDQSRTERDRSTNRQAISILPPNSLREITDATPFERIRIGSSSRDRTLSRNRETSRSVLDRSKERDLPIPSDRDSNERSSSRNVRMERYSENRDQSRTERTRSNRQTRSITQPNTLREVRKSLGDIRDSDVGPSKRIRMSSSSRDLESSRSVSDQSRERDLSTRNINERISSRNVIRERFSETQDLSRTGRNRSNRQTRSITQPNTLREVRKSFGDIRDSEPSERIRTSRSSRDRESPRSKERNSIRQRFLENTRRDINFREIRNTDVVSSERNRIRNSFQDRSLSRNREASRTLSDNLRKRDLSAASQRNVDERISSRNIVRDRVSERQDQSRSQRDDSRIRISSQDRSMSRDRESFGSSSERTRDNTAPSQRHFNRVSSRNDIRERSSGIRDQSRLARTISPPNDHRESRNNLEGIRNVGVTPAERDIIRSSSRDRSLSRNRESSRLVSEKTNARDLLAPSEHRNIERISSRSVIRERFSDSRDESRTERSSFERQVRFTTPPNNLREFRRSLGEMRNLDVGPSERIRISSSARDQSRNQESSRSLSDERNQRNHLSSSRNDRREHSSRILDETRSRNIENLRLLRSGFNSREIRTTRRESRNNDAAFERNRSTFERSRERRVADHSDHANRNRFERRNIRENLSDQRRSADIRTKDFEDQSNERMESFSRKSRNSLSDVTKNRRNIQSFTESRIGNMENEKLQEISEKETTSAWFKTLQVSLAAIVIGQLVMSAESEKIRICSLGFLRAFKTF